MSLLALQKESYNISPTEQKESALLRKRAVDGRKEL